jgi:hypothetical protein
MLAGRRANGALKIRSEPALVAATPEMGSILVVQDALPVGKLVQVEVAAEVQLEEGRCRVSKGDVPGLGSDAGEGLGGQLYVRDDLGPIRDRGPNNDLLGVGVQLVLLEVRARSNHDAGDLPRTNASLSARASVRPRAGSIPGDLACLVRAAVPRS